VATGPAFRKGVSLAHEGIVGREAAIGEDANHLAKMIVLSLSICGSYIALAKRDEQTAVAIKDQT